MPNNQNSSDLVESLIQLRDADWTLHNEAMPDDAQGVLNMAIEAIRTAMPAMPAMPNGVEGLVYAQRLAVAIWSRNYREVSPQFEVCDDLMGVLSQIDNMVSGMSAADNRDAAGVCATCNGAGMVGGYTKDGPWGEDCPACTPAAVPAGEAVAYSVVQVGNRGAAYDPPNTHRAFTYEHQPGNIDASRLGRATNAAAVASAGDSIDRGLSLLKELQALGFGVFQIGPPAPVQAAPQEGEQDTSHWPLLDRVEFALRDAGFDYDEAFRIAHMAAHHSACELGAVREALEAAARSLRTIAEQAGKTEGLDDMMNVRGYANSRANVAEAALQHRGDSQEVGRG